MGAEYRRPGGASWRPGRGRRGTAGARGAARRPRGAHQLVRHARARSVRLGLLYEREAVTLLVQDDGEGFDPTSGWQGDRFGLRDLTERAHRMGATIEVDSLAGRGTRIRARFPYAERAASAPRLRVLIAAGRPLLRAA